MARRLRLSPVPPPSYAGLMSEETLKFRPLPESEVKPFMRRMPIPADLRGLVASIVGYEEDGVPLSNAAEMAPLVVPLVIGFAEPFEIALGRAPRTGETYGDFTSGLYPGFVLINSTGRSKCIQIDFTPPGAFRFFGLPMSELASSMVGLNDLGDPGIALLRRRLGDLECWDDRIELAVGFVRERLHAGRPVSGQVSAAWRSIIARPSAVRVGVLADRLGWSRKHLVERFRAEIGLPPKSVQRMARFNAALALAARGEPLADIAHACGYADQAHLTRDFVEFAGRSPGEWRAAPAG